MQARIGRRGGRLPKKQPTTFVTIHLAFFFRLLGLSRFRSFYHRHQLLQLVYREIAIDCSSTGASSLSRSHLRGGFGSLLLSSRILLHARQFSMFTPFRAETPSHVARMGILSKLVADSSSVLRCKAPKLYSLSYICRQQFKPDSGEHCQSKPVTCPPTRN